MTFESACQRTWSLLEALARSGGAVEGGAAGSIHAERFLAPSCQAYATRKVRMVISNLAALTLPCQAHREALPAMLGVRVRSSGGFTVPWCMKRERCRRRAARRMRQ